MDITDDLKDLDDVHNEAHNETRLRAHSTEYQAKALALTHQHDLARGRGVTIQAGMYAGLAGHHVDEALMVIEYDDDGNEVRHASTLDEFAQFFQIYVDFGLFLFTLCNAGVKIDGVGAMAMLVLWSEWIGKFVGILLFYEISCAMGFPAPLGVRRKHIMVMGLIAGLGLTVALFVADVAFTDPKLKADSKLGAVLTPLIGFVCWGLSKFYDFTNEDVAKMEMEQLEEQVHHEEDALAHKRKSSVGNMSLESANVNTKTAAESNSDSNATKVSFDAKPSTTI